MATGERNGLSLAARLSRKVANSRREAIAEPPPATPDRDAVTPASLPNQGQDALIAEVYSLSTDGRYGEALALVVSALSRHASDGELLFARASVLFDWGRMREAREGFLQAERNGLSRTALYLNLAWSCHLLHLSDEAERHARKAVELDPSAVAAHFGLGTVLQRQKRYPAATASYEHALELAPDYADAAAGVAHCNLEQHQYAEAEGWMRRAIALSPDKPQYWNNLGIALANQERYPQALEALCHAEELESARGAPTESVVDRGFALILMGQDDAAAELYRANLPDLPDPRAHGHYALALLVDGRFREGWEQYEFRWLQEPHLSHRPDFHQPVWAGQDLAGKTILLRSEQGAGDIIQFARFAVPLKALGATVVLQVRPELTQLAQGFVGPDQVFAPPTPPPPFDYYVHLMSMARVLGTELATIPSAVPYLRVDSAKLQRWAPRFEGHGLKVGLAWAGNPAHPRDLQRSMPLSAISALWQLQGVRYFSLQKALRPGELEQFPPQTTLVDLGPDLEDFADTAAAIAQLDLVVCVDTAIAHIAGALGKPVWLMLPEIGDFRWLKGRDDSPWYPTMRLFRQRQMGQWDAVVGNVKAALEEAVRAGSLARPSTALQSRSESARVEDRPGSAVIREGTAAQAKRIARVRETRYGVMQYFPEADQAARSIEWYGEFLQPQLDLLACLVRPGAHVVEVGSGIGAHALSLAKMVGTEGQLFLYETRPVAQRVLLKNLQVNRVAQCVTLMRHDLAGPRAPAPRNAQAASSGGQTQGLPGEGYRTETLDELLLERLDLLKVRSTEIAADVLEGASATLWRLRPVLFVAAEDSAVASLTERVKAFGYRCWQMETALFNPANFNCRDTDIFAGQAALALLAIPEEAGVAVALDGCVEVADTFDRARAKLRMEPVQAAPLNSGAMGENAESGLLRLLRRLLL
jgi:tetratricopeptide (TPR) repeat protein